jgi:hypothetical protein
MRRPAALALLLLAGCAPPAFTGAPASPAYPPRAAMRAAVDPAADRARVEQGQRALHQRVPAAVAMLRDSIERIVSQLGERCVPRNPDGDGLHWQVSCATETLFGLGAWEPATPAVLERWRLVGQTLAQLQLDASTDARSLRVAISGFADHVQFATDHPCGELATFWNATLPPPADNRGRNAGLSFCRAARMAREIACASLPAGRCSSAALAARPALAFAVFGGSTTVLDRAPEHFTTPVALTATGATRCACQRFGVDAYGPPVAPGVTFAACPVEPERLFECEDARRVELDVWLDVDPRVPANTCRAQASDPNALALLCYQDGYHALSHQSALPRPRTAVTTDACATPNPLGWIEGRPRNAARPCAAEVSVAH